LVPFVTAKPWTTELNDAVLLQTAGSERWWRMREAALLAAGDAFTALADADDEEGGAPAGEPPLNIQALLSHVLEQVTVGTTTYVNLSCVLFGVCHWSPSPRFCPTCCSLLRGCRS
jgi:hypothetical protein